MNTQKTWAPNLLFYYVDSERLKTVRHANLELIIPDIQQSLVVVLLNGFAWYFISKLDYKCDCRVVAYILSFLDGHAGLKGQYWTRTVKQFFVCCWRIECS